MNNMTPVDFLQMTRTQVGKLQELEDQIDANEDGLKAMRLTERFGTHEPRDLSDTVAAILDAQDELQAIRMEVLQHKAAAMLLIVRLDSWQQREVLRKYYVERMSTDEIASELGYSTTWVKKHREAGRHQLNANGFTNRDAFVCSAYAVRP